MNLSSTLTEEFTIGQLKDSDKLPLSLLSDMEKSFKEDARYPYHQVDKLMNIKGYNLCQLTDNSWHLWEITVNIKTGLYKIISPIPSNMKGFASVIKNNFIFNINQTIYEFSDKGTKEKLKEMANDVYFQITRLTIVDKIENEKFKK